MVGIGVLITKYISLNPQPGIVECQLFDAYGNEWTFQDKTAIFASHSLDTDSDYPLPGAIACEVIKQWQDTNGREIVSIDTKRPWGVEAMTGESRFDVLQSQLIEI